MKSELKLAVLGISERHKHDPPTGKEDALKPALSHGTDWSLVTWQEWEIFHNYSEAVRKRAVELTFLAGEQRESDLTRDERDAVIHCLMPEEIYLLKQCHQIHKKNRAIRRKCSEDEKEDIRIYNHIVYHFEVAPAFRMLDDIDVYLFTESFFDVMQKHDLPVFEKSYYFIPNRRIAEVKRRGREFEHADV